MTGQARYAEMLCRIGHQFKVLHALLQTPIQFQLNLRLGVGLSVFHIFPFIHNYFRINCIPPSLLHSAEYLLLSKFNILDRSIMALDESPRLTKQRPQYDCLLFDLDDTLYPLSSGLTAVCTNNIVDYVNQKLGVEKEKVMDLCTELSKTYGTVTAGLKAVGYVFDLDDYRSFVDGNLPYENLKPDPVLKNLLLSMPQQKIIFTNADKVHTTKVLNKLGLQDCFQDVICFETLNPFSQITLNNNCDEDVATVNSTIPKTPAIICKPSKEAIQQALNLANADPQRTIFFDDSARNIAAGKRAGLHTVLVGTSVRTEGADFAIETIHNIREAVPEIWEEEEAENFS